MFWAQEESRDVHPAPGNGDRECAGVAFVGKALPDDLQWRPLLAGWPDRRRSRFDSLRLLNVCAGRRSQAGRGD